MESIGSYSRGDNAILDDMNGLEATELRLGLPGTSTSISKTKRPLDDQHTTPSCSDDTAVLSPAAKSQVVGWPPVQAFRRNARRHNHHNQECRKASSPASKEPPTTTPTSTERPVKASSNPAALLVKVSMDGAPYLRKIDLGSYNGYKNLYLALDNMFRSSPHHQLTYEDKDGDWMLAGDVPWEMFAASCKRLKITRAISAANNTGSTEQLLSTDLTLAA